MEDKFSIEYLRAERKKYFDYKEPEYIIGPTESEEDLNIGLSAEGLMCCQGNPLTGVVKIYHYYISNNEAYEAANPGGKLDLNQDSVELGLKAGYLSPNLDEENHYLNGLPHGYFLKFWSGGRILSETMYHKGQILWFNQFNLNGRLRSHIDYIDGIKHGPVINYSPDGDLLDKYAYVNGLIQGTWFKYWTNGNLRLEKTFKDGRQYGVEKHYDENGILTLEKECRQ